MRWFKPLKNLEFVTNSIIQLGPCEAFETEPRISEFRVDIKKMPSLQNLWLSVVIFIVKIKYKKCMSALDFKYSLLSTKSARYI